jgi:hypothetical protein
VYFPPTRAALQGHLSSGVLFRGGCEIRNGSQEVCEEISRGRGGRLGRGGRERGERGRGKRMRESGGKKRERGTPTYVNQPIRSKYTPTSAPKPASIDLTNMVFVGQPPVSLSHPLEQCNHSSPPPFPSSSLPPLIYFI